MRSILATVMALGMLSCGGPKGGDSVKPEDNVSAKVDSIMKDMTLEEKVGQMAQITLDVLGKGDNVFTSYEPFTLDPVQMDSAFAVYKVGSVLNTANNRARSTATWQQVIEQIQAKSMKEIGIPNLYGVDAIHGTTYTEGATFFPQQIGMAATFNRELVRRGAEVCAYETRSSNIAWNFSPVLDLGRDPRWPRQWETFGEDVYLDSEMGKQMILGYEGPGDGMVDQYHVASCLKHFLGYSVAQSGKDRTPAYIPKNELMERHVPAFRKAIEAGAESIMINSGLINGRPVHADATILQDLLRDELGFEGVIVTDWADIENLHNRDKVASTMKEAVKMAINAGIDMSMIPYNFYFCKALVELVNEGEVSMDRIDDAVRRILTMKYRLGLFERPSWDRKEYADFGSEQFEQSAYEAASESITLLKNEDNFLPLSKGTKILVTGPNAHSMRTLNGGWTYSWQGEKVEEFAGEYNTIVEALKAKAGDANVNFVPGVEYKMDGKYWEEENIDINAAVKAARNADVVVACIGENSYTEKPGDLAELDMSQAQCDLVEALQATGKPVVIVLNEGRPRIIRSIVPGAVAVLQTYLPGNFGADALADILYGDVNPSGRLPYTYPMFANTILPYDHKPSEKQEKMAGVYDYESNSSVQYEFGHGLSYTTFDYSDLRVSASTMDKDGNIEVKVKVHNTGERAGKETVLLFSKDLYASLSPDVRRLRAFEKISLEPKESREVSFSISARDLAFVNAENQLTAEKGEFQLMVGDLVQNIQLNENIVF